MEGLLPLSILIESVLVKYSQLNHPMQLVSKGYTFKRFIGLFVFLCNEIKTKTFSVTALGNKY